MKKKFKWLSMFLMLYLVIIVPARAGLLNRYHVGLPSEIRGDTVGARDLRHGQWLMGISAEVLWLTRSDERDKAILYVAANHVYNVNEAGKGSLGLVLGANTGKAGEVFGKVARILIPGQAKRLEWIEKSSNWVSIEGGGGYRAWGTPQGQSKLYWTLGGKVKIPIRKLWKMLRKK